MHLYYTKQGNVSNKYYIGNVRTNQQKTFTVCSPTQSNTYFTGQTRETET